VQTDNEWDQPRDQDQTGDTKVVQEQGAQSRNRKGGKMHTKGHLRDAFVEWVYAGLDISPMIDDEKVSPEWLIGKLWHSTDIMPQDICRELEMRPGTTYARAVRQLKEKLTTE